MFLDKIRFNFIINNIEQICDVSYDEKIRKVTRFVCFCK